MLGPFTFTFTFESEEFEKFEKVGAAAAADLYQTMITTRAPDGANKNYENYQRIYDRGTSLYIQQVHSYGSPLCDQGSKSLGSYRRP